MQIVETLFTRYSFPTVDAVASMAIDRVSGIFSNDITIHRSSTSIASILYGILIDRKIIAGFHFMAVESYTRCDLLIDETLITDPEREKLKRVLTRIIGVIDEHLIIIDEGFKDKQDDVTMFFAKEEQIARLLDGVTIRESEPPARAGGRNVLSPNQWARVYYAEDPTKERFEEMLPKYARRIKERDLSKARRKLRDTLRNRRTGR